MVLFYRRR